MYMVIICCNLQVISPPYIMRMLYLLLQLLGDVNRYFPGIRNHQRINILPCCLSPHVACYYLINFYIMNKHTWCDPLKTFWTNRANERGWVRRQKIGLGKRRATWIWRKRESFIQRFKSLPQLLDIILESCRLVVAQPKSSSIDKIGHLKLGIIIIF